MILCEPDRCQLPTATNLASQINRRFAWLSKTTLSLSISYTQYFSSSLYWAKTIVPRRGVRVYSAWINNNRIGKLGLGHQLLTSSLVIASCVRLRGRGSSGGENGFHRASGAYRWMARPIVEMFFRRQFMRVSPQALYLQNSFPRFSFSSPPPLDHPLNFFHFSLQQSALASA